MMPASLLAAVSVRVTVPVSSIVATVMLYPPKNLRDFSDVDKNRWGK
jgi:hypothetical protein